MEWKEEIGMQILRVTMTVEEIREKIVGKKVRIRYQSFPTTDEFLMVLHVEGPSERQRSKRGMVCTMYFEGGGYLSIHAGDVLRVLDANGDLIDSAEIQGIVSSDTLRLRRPGLTASLATVTTFEVYLEQPLVPHEQSNEQLLDMITDQVVFKRNVDYSALDTDGGQASDFNTMQDTLVANWATEGVQEGDYVVIDPAGALYVAGENGVRPIGDISITGRAPYLAGEPSALDDNRGFYRVTTDPSGADLQVDGSCRFAGGTEDGTDDEVFGDAGAEYALLPTIFDSTLTNTDPAFPFGGRAGQQALRPTAAAVANQFQDRVGFDALKSIQPFAYRIIRPSSLFSQDAIELVLFMRERMLSFIEQVKSVYDNGRGGDYYIFQRDDHIEDIGSPTDPSSGLGLLSNLVIETLQGLVDETPYANTSDCLSILGRRFWILDKRLDPPGYTDFVADSMAQRPVLPDMIDDVLDLDDRFRDLRYSWISFRADKVNGSIVQARRAEENLPEELEKQQELIMQRESLDKS